MPCLRLRPHGFTLIEMIVVIVLTGILLSVAMRVGVNITQTSKVEQTRQELNALAYAVAGNPDLQINGVRSDFGYVGDVGSLPADLSALATNPGYATWKGPYIANRFTQIADDYKKDAWGAAYGYSGVTIKSTGSGGPITRRISNSASDLLVNRVTGNVFDRDGTPPGPVFKNLIDVRLIVPDGSGSLVTKLKHPDAGGYFGFDSVPIGNQDLAVIYAPGNDTLKKIVQVAPRSAVYINCALTSNYWTDDTTLTLVPGSDSITGSPPCTDVSFWLVNNTGMPRTVTTVRVSWISPAAYYRTITWNGIPIFDLGGSPRGENGVTYTLSAPQTVLDGQKVKLSIIEFRQNNSVGGGNPVPMSSAALSVVLSDGTSFMEVLPLCE